MYMTYAVEVNIKINSNYISSSCSTEYIFQTFMKNLCLFAWNWILLIGWNIGAMGIKVQRPRCFFDIAINNQPGEKINIPI